MGRDEKWVKAGGGGSDTVSCPQEQCITFDRVLGSYAAEVGGLIGRWEEGGCWVLPEPFPQRRLSQGT